MNTTQSNFAQYIDLQAQILFSSNDNLSISRASRGIEVALAAQNSPLDLLLAMSRAKKDSSKVILLQNVRRKIVANWNTITESQFLEIASLSMQYARSPRYEISVKALEILAVLSKVTQCFDEDLLTAVYSSNRADVKRALIYFKIQAEDFHDISYDFLKSAMKVLKDRLASLSAEKTMRKSRDRDLMVETLAIVTEGCSKQFLEIMEPLVNPSSSLSSLYYCRARAESYFPGHPPLEVLHEILQIISNFEGDSVFEKTDFLREGGEALVQYFKWIQYCDKKNSSVLFDDEGMGPILLSFLKVSIAETEDEQTLSILYEVLFTIYSCDQPGANFTKEVEAICEILIGNLDKSLRSALDQTFSDTYQWEGEDLLVLLAVSYPLQMAEVFHRRLNRMVHSGGQSLESFCATFKALRLIAGCLPEDTEKTLVTVMLQEVGAKIENASGIWNKAFLFGNLFMIARHFPAFLSSEPQMQHSLLEKAGEFAFMTEFKPVTPPGRDTDPGMLLQKLSIETFLLMAKEQGHLNMSSFTKQTFFKLMSYIQRNSSLARQQKLEIYQVLGSIPYVSEMILGDRSPLGQDGHIGENQYVEFLEDFASLIQDGASASMAVAQASFNLRGTVLAIFKNACFRIQQGSAFSKPGGSKAALLELEIMTKILDWPSTDSLPCQCSSAGQQEPSQASLSGSYHSVNLLKDDSCQHGTRSYKLWEDDVKKVSIFREEETLKEVLQLEYTNAPPTLIPRSQNVGDFVYYSHRYRLGCKPQQLTLSDLKAFEGVINTGRIPYEPAAYIKMVTKFLSRWDLPPTKFIPTVEAIALSRYQAVSSPEDNWEHSIVFYSGLEEAVCSFLEYAFEKLDDLPPDEILSTFNTAASLLTAVHLPRVKSRAARFIGQAAASLASSLNSNIASEKKSRIRQSFVMLIDPINSVFKLVLEAMANHPKKSFFRFFYHVSQGVEFKVFENKIETDLRSFLPGFKGGKIIAQELSKDLEKDHRRKVSEEMKCSLSLHPYTEEAEDEVDQTFTPVSMQDPVEVVHPKSRL